MKKLLLIQYRDDVSAKHEADCFFEKSGLSTEQFQVLNSITDEVVQDPKSIMENVFAVILGGSGQYDVSKRPEPLMKGIEKTRPIIEYIIENDLPILGVCMGHQILSYILGADVIADSSMAETGSKHIHVSEEFLDDPIMNEIPQDLMVMLGHKDSVVNLPSLETLRVVGSSDVCPVEMYKYKNNIYSAQFHPELGPKDVAYRWNLYPEYVASKSEEELKKMYEEMSETPDSAKLLKNFITYYAQNN